MLIEECMRGIGRMTRDIAWVEMMYAGGGVYEGDWEDDKRYIGKMTMLVEKCTVGIGRRTRDMEKGR